MNKDVKLSTFGHELMMFYGRANLSQGAFATAVGISPSALRRWESDTSCPKAESLKRVIEVLLSKGAFSQGEERVEAMHLWELANKRGLKVPFDEAWFRGLMQDVGGVPCTTGQPIDQGNEENLIVPPSSDGGEDEIGVRHRTGASPVPTAPVHVPKRSGIGGKRKRLLFLLIALVILTIMGSAGTFFFYAREQAGKTAADPADPGYLSGHGTLVFFDSLSQEDRSLWSSYNGDGAACQFIGGTYRISQQQPYHRTRCYAKGVFNNFAFEVQLTITQGDCGGIDFRKDNDGHYYSFQICQNGRYQVQKRVGSSQTMTLFSGNNSPAIHTKLNQQNKIAVVASGINMTFYINRQRINHIQDSSYTSGSLALIAYTNYRNATVVAFSNARLWTL